MERILNIKNAADQSHGYWKVYHEELENGMYYNTHFFNDLSIGYEIGYEIGYQTSSIVSKWECHYINDEEIGCERYYNSQCYFNKPGKKFGEEITWKEK